MTSTQIDDRPQPMIALERANMIRLRQAGLRRELRGKPRPQSAKQLASIIRETDDDAYLRARVGYLIESMRQRGPRASHAILRHLRIPEGRRLGELTWRQRSMLSEAVQLTVPEMRLRVNLHRFDERVVAPGGGPIA